MPGAFTPTCSTYQLPGFENNFDKFKEKGIDDIYVVSVNDAFVMNAWASDLGIKNIKIIPDGNCEFTTAMGMNVSKGNLGFGIRSWRYAMVVDNCKIEKIFEFFNPEYFNIFISLLLNKLLKKTCVEIKNINGNISNTNIGVFINDK